MAQVQFSSVFPVPRKDLFQFLFLDGHWDRGLPNAFSAEILENGPFREKSTILWRVQWWGLTFHWGIRIKSITGQETVSVEQSRGFFEDWTLTQRLSDHGEATLLSDHMDYHVPLGILGCVVDDLYVRRELKKLLEARHEKILQLVSVK